MRDTPRVRITAEVAADWDLRIAEAFRGALPTYLPRATAAALGLSPALVWRILRLELTPGQKVSGLFVAER